MAGMKKDRNTITLTGEVARELDDLAEKVGMNREALANQIIHKVIMLIESDDEGHALLLDKRQVPDEMITRFMERYDAALRALAR